MPRGNSRVVIVCPLLPYPPTGGGVKRTLRLIEMIDRAGGRPHIMTTDRGAPGAADELRSRDWTVDVLDERPQPLRARVRQHIDRRPSPMLKTVKRRLREVAPESAVVHFEATQSAYYFEEVAGRPVVLSTQNVDSEMLASVAHASPPFSVRRLRFTNRWLSMRSVERRAVPRADLVLCVSDRDRRYYERFGSRVLKVPNGVDDEFFAVDPELPDSEDVLFVGQLDYQPNELGLRRFLREGWPLLAKARPRARLLVAGKGMSRTVAEEARVAERVVPLGFVHDLAQLHERCRLVIVPLWQGGGTRLKVLEALAAARPIVGTTLGVEGVGFKSGRHGLVADEPGKLASLAETLLGDPRRSAELARTGRELASGYRWDRVTEPAERLYREWLARS